MNGITKTKEKLQSMFMDWWDAYTTIKAYSGAYGIEEARMRRIVGLGYLLYSKNAKAHLVKFQGFKDGEF